MARIRTIKPEFWKNEDMSKVSEPGRLLAIALLNYADDEGYFNANEKLILAECFPLTEPSVNVHGMLTELSSIGYIRLGEASDGKRYGHIIKFLSHQKVSHAKASDIKELDILWEDSVKLHGSLTEASPLNRIEGNRIEKNIYIPESPTKLQDTAKKKIKIPIEEIIDDLNKRNGNNYSYMGNYAMRYISKQKKKGATLEQFIEVNRKMTKKWLHTVYESGLKPKKLYDPKDFENFLNEPEPEGQEKGITYTDLAAYRKAVSQHEPGAKLHPALEKKLKEAGESV